MYVPTRSERQALFTYGSGTRTFIPAESKSFHVLTHLSRSVLYQRSLSRTTIDGSTGVVKTIAYATAECFSLLMTHERAARHSKLSSYASRVFFASSRTTCCLPPSRKSSVPLS